MSDFIINFYHRFVNIYFNLFRMIFKKVGYILILEYINNIYTIKLEMYNFYKLILKLIKQKQINYMYTFERSENVWNKQA